MRPQVTALLAALALLGPVVVHDADERSPLGSVARPGAVAPAPAVYERVEGPWHQYWMVFARNDQDRGIVRTGRHAGDWEMVQIRVDGGGRPVEAVYAQHSGAERCGWSDVEKTRGGRPVVYLANGSHAAYFHPGVRDRMWPDPNDEADGRGSVVVPPVRPLGSWVGFEGRWGGAEAGWVPGEHSSPRGPAFQPQGRWSDPEGWARQARPCTMRRCDSVGECDTRESLMALAVPGVLLLGVVLWRRRTSAG